MLMLQTAEVVYGGRLIQSDLCGGVANNGDGNYGGSVDINSGVSGGFCAGEGGNSGDGSDTNGGSLCGGDDETDSGLIEAAVRMMNSCRRER